MNLRPNFRDLVELPDDYLFKIIVHPDKVDEARIFQTTSHALMRDLGAPELTARPSREGKYRAYSLKIRLETHEELEGLYRAYRAVDGVILVL